MSGYLDEAQVELITVDHFRGLGYAHGPDIAPDGEMSERRDYGQVVLEGRLRDVLGDEQLGFLAHELIPRVKVNTGIDWQVRESARARIRVLVKRLLRKYGYPLDMQQRATDLVLEQVKVLCRDWARTGSSAPLSERE